MTCSNLRVLCVHLPHHTFHVRPHVIHSPMQVYSKLNLVQAYPQTHWLAQNVRHVLIHQLSERHPLSNVSEKHMQYL